MQPTTLDHIIAFLLSARSTRIYRKILWSRVRARSRGLSANAFRQQIYRLNKQGVIKTEGDSLYICRQNLINLSLEKSFIIKTPIPAKSGKVLVSFDIPETKKKTRDWLRNQLKYWDFKMVHKSLWVGNGPLPKEFNERLKTLGINDGVRIFKVRNTP